MNRFKTRVFKDGREIADTVTYNARTWEMGERQKNLCAICGDYMFFPTFDHESGRGLGGGKRCDKILHDDGTWKNAAVCYPCNAAKGSKRYHWVDGAYIPWQK